MRQLHYSAFAELDLDDIAAYTRLHWSLAQAERYLEEIESCCKRLAMNPELARACGELWPGLRRMEQGSHVIFFSVDDQNIDDQNIDDQNIYVARILHKNMLPLRHKF